jgi:hypothetical protein
MDEREVRTMTAHILDREGAKEGEIPGWGKSWTNLGVPALHSGASVTVPPLGVAAPLLLRRAVACH